jgi:hypothetical protein
LVSLKKLDCVVSYFRSSGFVIVRKKPRNEVNLKI